MDFGVAEAAKMVDKCMPRSFNRWWKRVAFPSHWGEFTHRLRGRRRCEDGRQVLAPEFQPVVEEGTVPESLREGSDISNTDSVA